MAQRNPLDPHTLELVRFAVAIAQGNDVDLRERVEAMREAGVPVAWVEELLLQSVLMLGYPRALSALGVWRKTSGVAAPEQDADADYARVDQWVERGEAACARVYGDNYTKLRANIQALHPALDAWMITEGYGRTIARPALDLLRRELCIVAQVAMLETPRQLHSHLRGALNAGADFAQIDAALAVVNPVLAYEQWKQVKELWQTVRGAWEGEPEE